jgi:multiple antibiotic resistance protein
MSEAVAAFLLVFAALFPIVNPIEAAPFFYDLTQGYPVGERNALALRVARNGFCLLLGALILGPWVLDFFGLQLAAVRVAGGLVVTAIGWKLLTKEDHAWSGGSLQPNRGPGRPAGSFYPLTMPLTVGPGSLSVALALGSRKGELAAPLATAIAHLLGAVAGLTAISLSVYLCYRFSGYLARLLGETGIDVLVRLSAFILMCIGIQIIWSGVTSFLPAH